MRNSLSHFAAKGGKTEGQRATVTMAQHNSLEMGIFQVFTYNMGIYGNTIPIFTYNSLDKILGTAPKNTHIPCRKCSPGIPRIWNGYSLAPWNQAIEPLNPRVGYRTSLWSWLGFDQIVSHYIRFVDFLLPPPLNNPIVRKKRRAGLEYIISCLLDVKGRPTS